MEVIGIVAGVGLFIAAGVVIYGCVKNRRPQFSTFMKQSRSDNDLSSLAPTPSEL
jgi:hypothetical protein